MLPQRDALKQHNSLGENSILKNRCLFNLISIECSERIDKSNSIGMMEPKNRKIITKSEILDKIIE